MALPWRTPFAVQRRSTLTDVASGIRTIATAALFEAGGTTYYITPGGTITPAATLLTASSILRTGTITPTGSLTRGDVKQWGGVIAPFGVLSRNINKVTDGSITPSAVLNTVKASLQYLSVAGTITAVGTLFRGIVQHLSGSIPLSGTLTTGTEEPPTESVLMRLMRTRSGRREKQ